MTVYIRQIHEASEAVALRACIKCGGEGKVWDVGTRYVYCDRCKRAGSEVKRVHSNKLGAGTWIV